MIHTKAAEQNWMATSYEGIQVSMLRQNESGGGTLLLRAAGGARFPMHDHPGGEEVYVIDGRAAVGGIIVEKGDYLWTPPGEVHDLRAEEDTLLLITSANGIQVLE